MTKLLQRAGQALFLRLETGINAALGQHLNPLYHLGTITFFMFWVVAATGFYLYAFFGTGVHEAYDSVQHLTKNQWYLGGVLRSVHRYASDTMVFTMTLHVLRNFSFDRYRGHRWFSWLSGIPLIWFLYASGITGYWLIWDQLSQFIAVGTAEWLDWLPIFDYTLIRNFLGQASVSDRFFSLMSFLHIGIPLMLLALMWVHVQRITAAQTTPPKRLALGIIAALIVLALVKPALSHAPANLSVVPASLNLDWFLLAVFPFLYATSPATVWAVLGGGTLLFMFVPWLPRKKAVPVAVVSPDNCNGCGRCFDDCPYSAVTMEPRPDKPGERLAVVNPDLCMSCGICAGACPSSTPFRSAEELVTGIDLPHASIHALRAGAEVALEEFAEKPAQTRVIVYGCDHAAEVKALKADGVSVFSLPCTGQLPPSFIDYVLRDQQADGVLVTGCCQDDCAYRLGNDWTALRLSGKREPHLRTRVPLDRVHVVWAARNGGKSLQQELDDFRQRLDSMPKPDVTPVAPRVRRRRAFNE